MPNLWEQFKSVLPGKRIHPRDVTDGWMESLGSGATLSGVSVTPTSSLQTSAVLACVRVITESVATLPLLVYERLAEGKQRAHEHPLYNLLRYEPNPEMTAFEFIRVSTMHQVLWGNSYAQLEIDGAGKVKALWPIRPERVAVERNKETKEIEYKVMHANGGFTILPKWQMMHVPFFTLNGITGISLIGLQRLTVGLSVAAEEYGASFFGNGAIAKVILQHPSTLSEPAAQRLKKQWDDAHQGTTNAHKTVVLEDGMTLSTLSIPPNDAQFLETREFQLGEIARIFRVPPHLIGDLSRSTFNNIEHMSLEFVRYTLQPHMARWEQGIQRQLFLESEKKKFFTEFLIANMLRGDTLSRYQAYHQAKMDGWLSTNEIRELENLNKVDDGDDYWQPLNMVVIGEEPEMLPRLRSGEIAEAETRVEERTASRAAATFAGRRRAMLAWRRVLTESADRVVKKESAELRKLVKDMLREAADNPEQRNTQALVTKLDQYYDERFEQFVYQRMFGSMLGYAEETAGYSADEIGSALEDVMGKDFLENYASRYTNGFISRYVDESRRRLREQIEQANKNPLDESIDIETQLLAIIDEWEAERAAQIGQEESVREGGAVSWKVWALAGVAFLVWRTVGDSCPYCLALDGKTVGIDQNFLNAGEAFGGDDAQGIAPLVPLQSKHHPPAHRGCDCMISAGM